MALEINLGNIDKARDCCTGDYLLHPDSLQLYRVVRGILKTVFIVDVETAVTKLCYDNMNDLVNSSFYKNMILISESDFELVKKR